jgi:hypothetical protein
MRMGWARYVPTQGRKEMYTELWWGNQKERDNLEDQCLYGRVILKWILKEYIEGERNGSKRIE